MAPFYMYLGQPNQEYGGCDFQIQWLRLNRHGLPDARFVQWLNEIRTYSQQHNIDFQMVYAKSVEEYNASLLESKQLEFTTQKVIDLYVPASAVDEARSPGSAKNNVLRQFWFGGQTVSGDDLARKQVIVDYVSELICQDAKVSFKGPRLLLPFLLSDEEYGLADVLKKRIDLEDVPNFVYSLAIVADTQGRFIDAKTLRGLQTFLGMPLGDQLLAMVELRRILEEWATAPKPIESARYDLTKLHNDLREYFLPQQWTKKKPPTAHEVSVLAWNLRTGEKGIKSLLGALAWTLKAARAGDSNSQCVMGLYFGKCGDGERFLHWTKKSAKGGEPQAMFNLGTSYASGKNGLRKNLRIGLKYLLMAAKTGHRDATVETGYCYLRLREYRKAKRLLELAVKLKQREDYAYSHLGELYEKGWGVPKSKWTALGYYTVAADMGNEFAQKAARRLRKLLGG